MAAMSHQIDQVLIPRRRIARRVRHLAAQITLDHQQSGAEITLVPILTGAMIFCADLMRRLSMRLKMGLLTVSSYPGSSVRSQGPALLAQQLGELTGRHVLIVDDILDSGGTLGLVQGLVTELKPASLRTCVLLRKQRALQRTVTADYVGFDIPDVFVAGYGLDYDNYYRNLPDIVTLRPMMARETQQP